jgi:hypothetical protein
MLSPVIEWRNLTKWAAALDKCIALDWSKLESNIEFFFFSFFDVWSAWLRGRCGRTGVSPKHQSYVQYDIAYVSCGFDVWSGVDLLGLIYERGRAYFFELAYKDRSIIANRAWFAAAVLRRSLLRTCHMAFDHVSYPLFMGDYISSIAIPSTYW